MPAVRDEAAEAAAKAEAEAAASWQKIVRSPLAGAYLHELYWLARDVAEQCEQVFEMAPPPKPPASYVAVKHDVHATIQRALGEAARIRTLVASRSRRPDQKPVTYGVQKRRTAWLAGLLASIELPVLLDAGVRNSLEHFDEYLDTAALDGVHGRIPVPTFFLLDLSLGRAGTFDQFAARARNAAQHELRVYLAEERVFLNAGRRVDLGELHREAVAIRDRVAEVLPELARGDDRGGSMIFVADW